MHKKILNTTLFFILMLLIIPMTAGQLDPLLDRESGVPTTNWYEVADWEVNFCMDRGGTSASIEHGSGTIGDETRLITHNRILSIQAERNDIIPSSDNVALINSGAVVYEIAWFVQPLQVDEDLSYEITKQNSYGITTTVDSGNANFVNPARGYVAEESSENLTSVVLRVWGLSFEESLQVDVV
ncbi:MAG: hypothetical protein ABIA62_07660 [Candidatus Woesearchaeota archaeon]